MKITREEVQSLITAVGQKLDDLSEGDCNGDMHPNAMKSLALFHRIDKALRMLDSLAQSVAIDNPLPERLAKGPALSEYDIEAFERMGAFP